MVYIPIHKRKVVGTQVHQSLEAKRKAGKEKPKEEKFEQIEESEQSESDVATKKRKEIETKYLVPKINKWIETDSVKVIKEKIKKWLSLNHPVHIIGPTGCGKTILALKVAKELGRPTVWINGDESVTTTDLIGGYSQVEVNSIRDKYIHNVFKDKDILKAEWIDNPLTLACKHGYTLIYNEFSRSKAVANNILLSIFSEGILELPTKFGEERYVEVHPDFRVIFISNSIEYAGIHKVQDALLDRMIGVYMDYYDKETEARIVATQSGIKEEHAILVSNMLSSLRKKLLNNYDISTRMGVMVAQALKSANNYDKRTIKEALADVIISKTHSMKDFEELMKIVRRL